jgi:hypothetical protein
MFLTTVFTVNGFGADVAGTINSHLQAASQTLVRL